MHPACNYSKFHHSIWNVSRSILITIISNAHETAIGVELQVQQQGVIVEVGVLPNTQNVSQGPTDVQRKDNAAQHLWMQYKAWLPPKSISYEINTYQSTCSAVAYTTSDVFHLQVYHMKSIHTSAPAVLLLIQRLMCFCDGFLHSFQL